MAKSLGGDDLWQRLERVTEAANCIALPDDFEDSAFEYGDLQRSEAEDPSQFTDAGLLEDDHTDLWDVFLTDSNWTEPEPERGEFWLNGHNLLGR